MPRYRVFGSKEHKYYIDVEAEDKLNAYTLANQMSTDKWNGLVTDDVIEIYEVEDDQIEFQQVILMENN